MPCTIVALALLSPAVADLQGERVLTQTGRTLSRVSGAPSSVDASWWQYRLYGPNTPAIADGNWGIVEGANYADTQRALVRMRHQQATWWGWLGAVGRPEPMPFTSFNALGPIALKDAAAWSASWSGLGSGAAREVAARKHRLEAAQAAEDALYRFFDESNWKASFEENPFRNAGLNIYQAPWLVLAMTHLRALEADLHSAYPISYDAANKHLAAFSDVARHLETAVDMLDKRQPAAGALTTPMTSSDAVSILNAKFTDYEVRANEGGAGSLAGTMSWRFTETGFQLSLAPEGWYGGIEPVSYISLDPTTVRYDPRFGGDQRGGLVFLPKDNLRAGYRGPSGILLPLDTHPRDAETLAQALRRLVRIANGVAVSDAPKAAAATDAPTKELADRLRDVMEKLDALGNLRFRDQEYAAQASAALVGAVGKRDRLWRDSELGKAMAPQLASGAAFYLYGAAAPMPSVLSHLGIPMNLSPVDPPIWRIIRVNYENSNVNLVVRQACQAKAKGSGQLFTVFRITQETWSGGAAPHLLKLRLISAGEVQAPAPAALTYLAHRFFDLGGRYMRVNRLPEAERMLRRAIAVRPDWASAWNWLGVSVIRQGRIDDAAEFVAQSVLINPRYPLALSNLSDIRRVQGRLAESIDLATKATMVAPKDPWARVVLGHADFARGKYTDAESQYRVALELDPSNGETHADLAGALLREDKKSEATSEASRAIELGCRNHWVFKELAIPK